MTLGEKLDSAWLDSLDYWSGRTPREPGMGGLLTKRLPPIVLCVAALTITVLARIVFLHTDDGFIVLGTLGPGAVAWGYIKQSNTRARERHDARPERRPEKIEAVKRSLLAAAEKSEQAMATTRAALAQSHQLSADLEAQLDSLKAALPQLQEDVEDVERLLAAGDKALRARVIEPAVRHLDRMGLVFAASGWVVAVLVVVFDHSIPRW